MAHVFYDILKGSDGTRIAVMSKIRMLATEDGGRNTPVFQQYRPNHNFGDTENRRMYIGQVEIDTGDCIKPGESKELIVTFVNAEGLEEHLVPGRTWRIQEGIKLVGFAEVMHVVEKIPPKKKSSLA